MLSVCFSPSWLIFIRIKLLLFMYNENHSGVFIKMIALKRKRGPMPAITFDFLSSSTN
jgi:hypothetical protein